MFDLVIENRPRMTLLQALVAGLFMLACALVFWNPSSQSSSWIYPYFSGASNLGINLSWGVDATRYADFANLTYAQQLDYRFQPAEAGDLSPYSVLDKGYVYIVWLAQTMLFWLPPIKGVIWLQILFHIGSSLCVMSFLSSRWKQLVFLFAYAVNPVVLHFVTFAYYYYWQVVPSLVWFLYENRLNRKRYTAVCLLALALAAAFMVRQSTALVSLFILLCAAWNYKKFSGWLLVIGFVFFVMFAKNPSQPWHTAYIGIGAYSNDAGIELDDESGYKMFKRHTGIQINTMPPNGTYYDESIRGEYYKELRGEFLDYVHGHPVQMARNAILNTLESFSFGYPVGHVLLAYASAFIGLGVLGVLVFCKMYQLIILIFAGVAGFAAYYPPIPAYMFGNYFLLAFALATVVDKLARYITRRGLRSS